MDRNSGSVSEWIWVFCISRLDTEARDWRLMENTCGLSSYRASGAIKSLDENYPVISSSHLSINSDQFSCPC
ncbi:hypothetical protein AMECASPLE_033273 [Ameca splendens]|uniref:Uncharacterized protein n=1 Tax=Ameca splendens TaxID=208324 RepID=A0ABV1A2K9_9TELE